MLTGYGEMTPAVLGEAVGHEGQIFILRCHLAEQRRHHVAHVALVVDEHDASIVAGRGRRRRSTASCRSRIPDTSDLKKLMTVHIAAVTHALPIGREELGDGQERRVGA